MPSNDQDPTGLLSIKGVIKSSGSSGGMGQVNSDPTGLLSIRSKPFDASNPVFSNAPAQVTQAPVVQPQQNTLMNKVTGLASFLGKSLTAGTIKAKSTVEASAGMVVQQFADALNKYDMQKLQEEKKKSQPNQATVKFLENKIKAQSDLYVNKVSDVAKKIKQASLDTSAEAKKYVEANLPLNNPKNFWEAVKDPKWIASQILQNTPSMVASMGLGVATAAVTKNPAAGVAVGFASSYAQNAGSVYVDAREYGIDDKQAEKVGIIAGSAMALFDTLPIGRIIERSPQAEVIKKQVLKEITASIVKQGFLEGGTESIQQIIQNVAAHTYDKNKDLFEGVPEAGLIGGIMGSATGAVADATVGIMSKPIEEKPPAPVSQATEPKETLKYTPSPDLSPEEAAIETRMAERLNADLPGAMAEYRQKFGNVLNTDNVREFSQDYQGNRSLYSAAVHEPSSEFTKWMYEKMLAEPDPTGEDLVVGTAGGTGAGKSTAIDTVPEMKLLKDSAQIIYDTNANRLESASKKIDQALKAGKRFMMMYIQSDPLKALEQAIARAKRMGRTVPLSEHIATHKGAYETIFQLAEKYKDNPDVDIQIIDNRGGKGEAFLSDLEKIKGIEYNVDEITNKANELLDRKYQQNDITKDIYDGFKGKEKDTTKGVVKEDSIGSSQDVKPQGEARREVVNPPKKEVKQETVSQPQEPVGTGKSRQSRLQERVREQLLSIDQGKYDYDPKTGEYNRLNLEEDASNAVKFLEENPEDALRVASGFMDPPNGQTANSISMAVALKAREEGNYKLYSDLLNKVSLRSTRMGQEIVSLRGHFNDDSPENFVRELLHRRMEKLGTSLVTTAEATVGKMKAVKEKAAKTISEKAKKLSETLRREQKKISLAQDIINSLRC